MQKSDHPAEGLRTNGRIRPQTNRRVNNTRTDITVQNANSFYFCFMFIIKKCIAKGDAADITCMLVHTCVRARGCVCAHVRACEFVCASARVCGCACVRACAGMCMHVRVHPCAHTRVQHACTSPRARRPAPSVWEYGRMGA